MQPAIPFLPENISNILILIAVLAVVWVLVRFIFKLATRVMALGCVGILALGAILVGLGLIR